MITIKTKQQIEDMREAGYHLSRWMQLVDGFINNPTLTGIQIAETFEAYLILNLPDYNPIFRSQCNHLGNLYGSALCISVDNQIVHTRPTDKQLPLYSLVKIDAGFEWHGICVDMARTFYRSAGPANPEKFIKNTKMIITVETMKNKAIETCRAGAKVSDISQAIEESAGEYNIIRTFCGHGIGSALHESPRISNVRYLADPDQNVVLCPGMTICIEPMISEGSSGVVIDADGWSVRSDNGGLTAHSEDQILITDGEPEVLTRYR